MHSVPMIFAMRRIFKDSFTVTAFVFFYFVMKSIFVLDQITGCFTFILALDSIFYPVAYIVVIFEMDVVHVVLQMMFVMICFVTVWVRTRMLTDNFRIGLILTQPTVYQLNTGNTTRIEA